jgi:hypothetical protein
MVKSVTMAELRKSKPPSPKGQHRENVEKVTFTAGTYYPTPLADCPSPDNQVKGNSTAPPWLPLDPPRPPDWIRTCSSNRSNNMKVSLRKPKLSWRRLSRPRRTPTLTTTTSWMTGPTPASLRCS